MRAITDSGRPRAAARPPAGRTFPPTFTWLLAVVVALNVFGLVMVLSASSVQSLRETGSTWSTFLRQLTWLGLGTLALGVTVSLDYRRWRRLAPVLLIASLAALVAVLVPGVGSRVNGARSWIAFGPLSFQPSEAAKLALLLFTADLLARRSHRMADHRVTMRPILVVSGAVVVLMMLQPDLGSTIVLGSVVLAVLFVSGVPLLPLTVVTAAGAAASLTLALSRPYRRARLLSFLHPSADPGNTGYQGNQSLMGVASGRLTGVGLGESRAKYGFLPNAHTDFIFAIVSEELGLLGAMTVILLFLAFAYLGVRAALAAPDRFGTLVAAGITAWVLTQAFVNIGGVVGVLPITGLTLPFVSFGGTSLIISMAATGILLNIARQGRSRTRKAKPAGPQTA
jgi:cell division protein FtsW